VHEPVNSRTLVLAVIPSFLLTLLLFGQPSFADSCEQSLSFVQRVKSAATEIKSAPKDLKDFWMKGYWPEFRRTYGRRLFTKAAGENDVPCFYEPVAPRSELGPVRGFFRDCNPISTGYWLFNDRPREQVFQPFRGAVRYILKEPIGALTQRWFDRREVFTWPIYWPAYLAVTLIPWIGAYHYIDQATDALRDDGMIEQSQKAKFDYLHELSSNFQFHDIRQKLDRGETSEQNALLSVRIILDILNTYYSYDRDRLLVAEPSDEQIVELLKNPLFAHLSGLAAKGLQPNPTLEVPAERLGPIPARVIYMMIRETDRLYFEYQIIKELAGKTKTFESMLNINSAFGEISKSLIDDPFTRKLETLLQTNQINRDQFQYALGESTYWKTRLSYFQLLGAKQRKDGGGYKTLADYQDGIYRKLLDHR
jgi:hypothetical protein